MGLSRIAKRWKVGEATARKLLGFGFDPNSPVCEFSHEWPLDIHAFQDAMFASSAVSPLAVVLDADVVERKGLLMVVPELMQTVFPPADTRSGTTSYPDWYIRARVVGDKNWHETAPTVHLKCLVDAGSEGRRWAREGLAQITSAV